MAKYCLYHSVVTQFMPNSNTSLNSLQNPALSWIYPREWNNVKNEFRARFRSFYRCRLGGSPMDKRSTPSYYTLLGGNIVTWRNKKKTGMARSSAKTESHMEFCEFLWLKIIRKDLIIKWQGPMNSIVITSLLSTLLITRVQIIKPNM